MPGSTANHPPFTRLPSLAGQTALCCFPWLGWMVITRRGFIWGLSSTNTLNRVSIFLLIFVAFECADFQALLHIPEGWLHLRFSYDHVSSVAGVLKTTNTVWFTWAGAWCCLKSLPNEINIDFHMNRDKILLRVLWGVQDTGLWILFHPALSFMG